MEYFSSFLLDARRGELRETSSAGADGGDRFRGVLLTLALALLSSVLTLACEAFLKRGAASLHWLNLQLYVVDNPITALKFLLSVPPYRAHQIITLEG